LPLILDFGRSLFRLPTRSGVQRRESSSRAQFAIETPYGPGAPVSWITPQKVRLLLQISSKRNWMRSLLCVRKHARFRMEGERFYYSPTAAKKLLGWPVIFPGK